MKKEKEIIRKKIVDFWKDTKNNIEKRKSFLTFMEDNEFSQSAMYNYMRSECVGIALFKLKAILVCIDQFSELQKK